MNLQCKMLMALVLGGGLLIGPGLMPTVAGDHEHSENHHRRQKAPLENNLYRNRCGECHLPFFPGLLPAASWRKILAAQSDHFGEELSLDQREQQELAGYLDANAADRSRAKISRKIMKSLGGHSPVRITEIPYIIHKHDDEDIPEGAFRRKSVGSFANCGACHPGAAAGDFHDDDVRIPAQ